MSFSLPPNNISSSTITAPVYPKVGYKYISKKDFNLIREVIRVDENRNLIRTRIFADSTSGFIGIEAEWSLIDFNQENYEQPLMYGRTYQTAVPNPSTPSPSQGRIIQGFTSIANRIGIEQPQTVSREAFPSGGCQHNFVPYVGFSESYEYCTKCDQKRNR